MKNEVQLQEVKAMEPQILEELAELLINVVEDGASIGFLSPLSKDDAREYWKEAIAPGVIVLIAKVNGKIVGTIQLQMEMKENGSHRAEVAKLMVETTYRRNGIAKLLMAAIEEIARLAGRSLLVLDTRSGDHSNYLYRSMEYIEAGQIPKYAKSSNGNLDTTVFYYKEI
ncbi:GNAT family N-acetyltransferase [Paenibacillus septentrionalis]|uniref:GNAT family N-acetyltransferase n=1 Tax=Paenibacillus septentrionalis TaxID=429342 RepID=A0ABW1V304_9BACL